MAYIRKKYRELLQYMDDNSILPKSGTNLWTNN